MGPITFVQPVVLNRVVFAGAAAVAAHGKLFQILTLYINALKLSGQSSM